MVVAVLEYELNEFCTNPATLDAVEALPLKVAVIVPALKLPEESRATIAEAVFALVALDVTVKVALVAWFAVKVCEPDNPVPETASVKVPLLTVVGAVHEAVVPVEVSTVPLEPMARRVALLMPLPRIRSPVVVMGDKALNAAAAVV